MLKNNDLRMVRIGCFKDIMEGGYVIDADGVAKSIINLELNPDTISYITCIIDDEEETAIDIFTGVCYHILKRDKNFRIIEPQENIEYNKYYALSVEKETMKTNSQLYNIYLNFVANQAAKEYSKKSEKLTADKVLKKEKKKEK